MMSEKGRTWLKLLQCGRRVRAMDSRAFERGAGSAPCTRQLQRGLKGLRFDDVALESEFRRRYTDLNIGRIRAAVAAAVLLVFMVAVLDLLTAPEAIRIAVFAEKIGLLLPVPLITLWVAYHPRYYAHIDRAMFAAVVTVGCIFAAIHTQFSLQGFVQPHYSAMLVIAYSYFLSALLWPGCVIAAVVVTLAAIGGDLYAQLPIKDMLYSAMHLVAANLIGMVGSFTSERVSRLDYLHAGSASEMADIDRVTSLRSADSFARRLERWWEKAVGRKTAVGVMFIDIDYFRRFDQSCGHYEAEKALRTIAQAIQDLRSTQECFLARLDDDGFGVIMRDATPQALQALANEIREAVVGLHIAHPDSPIADHLTVTIVGRVKAPTGQENAGEFNDGVRAELDRVKRCKRDSVWVEEPPLDTPPDPASKVTPLRRSG